MRESAKTFESELSANELDALLNTVKKFNLRGKYLEIGTAAGGTLWRIMSCFNSTDRPPFVVVDTMQYFENQYDIICENLKNHNIDPDGVDFRRSTSNDAFLKAKENKEEFDFIFIDGSHKIKYVTQDLRWGQLLKVNGVLCLHDYTVKHRGVAIATNKFLKRNCNYEIVSQIDTLLIVVKKEKSRFEEVSRLDIINSLCLAPLLQLEIGIKKRLNRFLIG